jgi:peptidyl-prolyl cis-trans isomerase B (cyclophilin B)
MSTRTIRTAMSVVLVVAACGGPATIDSAAYKAFRDQPTACGATAPEPAHSMQFTAPEDLSLTDTITAVIHTSCGDITISLYPQIAPATVDSFVFLAEHGYFDGTVTHRIVPGYIVQFGDPTATGRGNPGYALPDELPPDGFPYTAGVVAMANAGANTGGSQFFIVLGDTGLPTLYTVFGGVEDGTDALTAIQSVPLGMQTDMAEQSKPLQTVYIESIDIQR